MMRIVELEALRNELKPEGFRAGLLFQQANNFGPIGMVTAECQLLPARASRMNMALTLSSRLYLTFGISSVSLFETVQPA
jgi:hypothetical protein